jgi:hypothetical protein
MNNILDYLVVYNNAAIRSCKTKLETAEKSRDIAVLQGRIIGYRKLLTYLKEYFDIDAGMLEDNGEEPEDPHVMDDDYLRALSVSVDALNIDNRMHKLEDRVIEHGENAKMYLLSVCEDARSLFMTQAEYHALTCYEAVFRKIRAEHEERKGDLFHNVYETLTTKDETLA